MQSRGLTQSGELPIIAQAIRRRAAAAVVDLDGQWRYDELLAGSAAVAARLLNGRTDLNEARVALAIPAGGLHVAAQWGCWRAGGVVVPLSNAATASELGRLLADSSPEAVMVPAVPRPEIVEAADRCGIPLLHIDRDNLTTLGTERPLFPAIDPSRRAMILCTSGTTSQPKGVVFTHASLGAQVDSLVNAWRWTDNDRIPLFLPLHHVHGIVNVMTCCLWAGGLLETFERFDMATITERVAAGRYTVFMAVPTIYHRLIEHLESLDPATREHLCAAFRGLRLMVSGSAALPASVHERWAQLTGQALLERYGMTETGMALSNPYDGERRPGAVGVPLPGVEVRLVDDAGTPIRGEGVAGEIEVRGPTVFREYWNDPDASAAAFHDGWFRTGDVAVVEAGAYRILGRKSMDIIKSGGYKLSALEIEAALLEHPAIAECAVVGVPDDAWGEIVAAAVVPRMKVASAADSGGLSLDILRDWCRSRLSPYRIPRRLHVCDSLPRNPMGKVVKNSLVELFTRSVAAS